VPPHVDRCRGVSVEHTLFQWREGERRVREAPAERRGLLERVTERLVAELRRRLGGTFTTGELVELYLAGTDWCLDIAVAAAPQAPWAWEAGTVADAAFGRYAREAADYAGGRRVATS
jgi:hypothetical protein